MNRFVLVTALTSFVITAGCSSNTPDPAPVAPAAAEPTIKRVDAASLPKLVDLLPPLEDGTLEISGTENTERLDRRSSYICGFHFGDQSSPPRILLTAEPNPYESLSKLTDENLEEFAKLTQERLDKGSTKPLENALPMVIGSQACVRYVMPTKFKNAMADRQILETIRNGKIYRLDLQVFAGQITTYRDDAYAIFAGMKFTDAGGETPSPAEPAENGS